MSVEEYLDEHIWVPIVIGVGGGIILLVIIILLCCLFCHFTRRSDHRRYELLRGTSGSPTEDTVSYGSLVIRGDEEDSKAAAHTEKSVPPDATIQSAYSARRTSSTAVAVRLDSDAGGGAVGGSVGGASEEIGLYEAWENRRQSQMAKERETAVLACQFHIRNAKRYRLLETLPDIGSRIQKYWFLVHPVDSDPSLNHLILTIAPVSKLCSVQLQGASLVTLNELLVALKHPYLQPITEVDYVTNRNSVLVVQPFASKGSIKDLIYKSQPLSEWPVKYSMRRKGLPLDTIALCGRQVLEALVFLYKKGFPPLGHIQSGNVLLDDASKHLFRLSGYESTLLGYRTRQYKLFAEHVDSSSIDVLMFGHLLFEMGCGYELTTMSPQQRDYQAVHNQPLLEVLQFIFSTDDGGFPSLQQVLELPFFQRVQLQKHGREPVHLSSEMKALLKVVRKGQPVRTHLQTRKKSSRHGSEDRSEARYPVTQLKTSAPPTTRPPPASVPSRPRPAKPPPPPKKKDLSAVPAKATPPRRRPARQSRGALLKDIHRGKRLKKVATDDRSAPRLS